MVILAPGIGEIVVLPVAKLVPVKVTNVVTPRTPTGGLMLVRMGVPGSTVNGRNPLDPLGVPTPMT